MGTSHLRANHPLLAHRQCDSGMPAAGGSAPGHRQSMPAVLGLTHHQLHDLCKCFKGLLVPGEHQHPILYPAPPTLTWPFFPSGMTPEVLLSARMGMGGCLLVLFPGAPVTAMCVHLPRTLGLASSAPGSIRHSLQLSPPEALSPSQSSKDPRLCPLVYSCLSSWLREKERLLGVPLHTLTSSSGMAGVEESGYSQTSHDQVGLPHLLGNPLVHSKETGLSERMGSLPWGRQPVY